MKSYTVYSIHHMKGYDSHTNFPSYLILFIYKKKFLNEENDYTTFIW